jgi:O-antigen ligase
MNCHSRGVEYVWSFLLVASAVDAIDLGGGALPVVLTPFLLLAAVFCGVAVFLMPVTSTGTRIRMNGPGHFVSDYGFLLWFVVVGTLSAVFVARDSLGAGIPRLFYLYWVAGFAVFFALGTRDRLPAIVLRATTLYVVLDAAFIALQCCSVYFDIPVLANITVVSVGDLFRLSGLTGDPNRAAMNLILMVGLRYLAVRETGGRGIGGWPSMAAIALSLLTLSRSGLIGLATLLVALLAVSGVPFLGKLNRLAVTAAIGLALGAGGMVFLSHSPVADTIKEAMVSDPLRESSTSIHLELLQRGLEMTVADPKTFIIGKGWGTEYEYTKDYFHDTKFGNFHSMFFSVLVQSGFAGLVPFLLLLLRPAWIGSRRVLLVPVILMGGIFYQMHGEPFWWIVVVLMNTTSGGKRPATERRPHSVMERAECTA